MEEKETIICAAIKMPDGYIVRGHRHNDAIRTASGIPRYAGLRVIDDNQGFLTSKGRYVGREEAHIIAGEAKQISSRKYNENTRLFSEDLY